MKFDLSRVGSDWLAGKIDDMVVCRALMTPSEFCEAHRYLPNSVTSIPGPMSLSVNPFMREILDCFDVDSPVREINVKKGVQVTYTTVLECGIFYLLAHIGIYPVMMVTADKELAHQRMENYILPMFEASNMSHIIRSADMKNGRKTGKTKDLLQVANGGFLAPIGAQNPNKMRSLSILACLKDEVDGWPLIVGRDGDPDALTSDRCSGYWTRRKIFRGSTPLVKGSSKIQEAYLRGDQRLYHVLCLSCGHPQPIRWQSENERTGVVGGFQWDVDDGKLNLDSVRWCCAECGHAHYERDKRKLFSPEHGAKWVPTAEPAEPGIRSYHIPAFLSPIGMQPWSKCVAAFLAGFDPERKEVKDLGRFQTFYNNILGEPFEIVGMKVKFSMVSSHRRPYSYGVVPNKFAKEYAGSKILLLVCTVDVHKERLHVAVTGVCRNLRTFLIEYIRIEAEDCTQSQSPAWESLRRLIEDKVYVGDDGSAYNISITLVDSSWSNDRAVAFCSEYQANVYPILGRQRPGKNQRIQEFSEFQTKLNTLGYLITVDHYKDRLASALRSQWVPDSGIQPDYHVNLPVDVKDAELKELTTETRVKKTLPDGSDAYAWHRPKGAANELWDLLVYAHAAAEIVAYRLYLESDGNKTLDWNDFWKYIEEEEVFFSKAKDGADGR